MSGKLEDERFCLARWLALSAAKVEKRQCSRASKALVCGEIGKWTSLRTLSKVGNRRSLEDIKSILLFIGASVEPRVRSYEIISIDVVHNLAAL